MKRKQSNVSKILLCTYICVCMLMGVTAFAQNKQVTGTVLDERNESVISASVVQKGTLNGTVTDVNGRFSLEVPENATLVVSYIGYKTQEIPVAGQRTFKIVLKEDQQLLGELVVIGYGSVKKSDLTGSITAIGEKDFKQGLSTSPAELIGGKVAGVQITSNGGRAGSGARIRIRGGASLNASNDPLIVIDGVPIDNGDIMGSANPLATINPNDIESMNVLKDASATAIYGSRASNGVILITTKKGTLGQVLKVDVSSQNSIATVARKVDVLSGDEYRDLVKNYPGVQQRYLGWLGTASTDWQDEIFRSAFTTDNNISISGSAKNMPYRASVAYLNQNGILKTDNLQRVTGSFNLSPTFFDNHLTVNLNAKGTYAHQKFANSGAIGAALRMDPTKPVKADGFDQFNGYWTWLDGETTNPNSLATMNPVALLMSRDDQSDVLRSLGNAQFDYKFHFLPELRANLNLGYDVSQGKGKVIVPQWAPQTFTLGGQGEGGERTQYEQNKRNLLFEFYLNYNTYVESLKSRFDIVAGYTYQDWKTTTKNFDRTTYSGKVLSSPTFPQDAIQNTLLSYYGRLNYTLLDRYLITATVRRDASSRFGTDNRWGTFPSVALAWRIFDEAFMKDFSNLSNLKLRLGFGVTGQQDGIGNYDYIPTYSYSEGTAMIQIGDNFYHTWRPNGYDKNRKWEETKTWNVGLDYGFFDNRISGSVDYYYKETSNLLNEIPIPMGTNYTNQIIKNIGSLNNRGIEASISLIPVETKDWHWDLGFNVTYNKTRIEKLSMNDGLHSSYVGVPTGGVSGGTGSTIQIHSVGFAPNAFYVYKQLYFEDGTPVEGGYADLNGDGVINEQDRYQYKKADPDVFMGFNTNVSYKRWTFNTALRANLGNYAYNNINADAGNYSQVLNPSDYLMNSVKDILNTQFYNRQLFSDYYIQNASFLKMDYLTVGYDFGEVFPRANLRANFTVQNVFTITNYDGVDPEIGGGIDNNFYPNPRTFMVGLNLSF